MPTFGDNNFNDVVLLLKGEGTSGSTTFTDSSPRPKTLTPSGTAQISAPEGKFGPSGFFDGNGDYLSSSYNAAFDLLGSPFTIECWIRPTERTSDRRILSTGGGTVGYNTTTGIHILLQILSTGELNLQWANGASGASATSTTQIALNTWTHISACISGTTAYLGINGSVTSYTISALARPSTNPQLAIGTIPGESGNAAYAFKGFIDDLRITKNIARYTTNFTPPAAAFTSADPDFANVSLLLPMDTSFADISSNAFTLTVNGNTTITTAIKKFGSNALYLPNTSTAGTARLSFDSSEVAFGTNDFTIECWVYLTHLYDYISIFTTRPTSAGNANAWHLGTSATGGLTFYSNATDVSVGTGLTTGTWYHVAATRSGTTLRLFINGTNVATSTTFTKNLTNTTCGIGDFATTSGEPFPGYLDEIRLTRNVSRYNSNFSVPTASFPTEASTYEFSYSPAQPGFSYDVYTAFGRRSYSPVMAGYSRDVYTAFGRRSYSPQQPGFNREGYDYQPIYKNSIFVDNPLSLLAKQAVIKPYWRKPKRTVA